MESKSRFLITTLLVLCHWVLTEPALAQGNQSGTAQLLHVFAAPEVNLPAGTAPDTVTLHARTLTAVGGVYTATGDVEIDYGGIRLTADQIRYDSATGEAVATGHVAFDSVVETTHIEGDSGTYNFQTSVGSFNHFAGVSGIRMHAGKATLLSNNPLIFRGARLLRLGPNHYRLENGMITSCTLPNPKWTLTAARVDIELGANATLHDAVFRLMDVPIFYAPFLTHSTERSGRHSGFLLPMVGNSNSKGASASDSFFWAAARNLSVTGGAEFFTKRGFGDLLDIEGRPTDRMAFGLQLDGVLDRGIAEAGGIRIRQGGQELRLSGDHEPISGFRTVLDVDYLSSYIYRLAFQNSYAAAINSEAVSTAFTEKQSDGYDLAIAAHRYQNFLGTTPTASLSLASLPSVDFTSYDRPLALVFGVPLYFSWDTSGALLDRSQPGFRTGLLDRFDVSPELTAPVHGWFGDLSFSVSADSTYYSEREQALVPSAAQVAPALLPGGLVRNAATADVEWRPPVLERVFDTPHAWFGDKLKHVFEPTVGVHITGGVGAEADNVIRFDDRDILSDTREVEYGFTNRFLVRRNGQQSSELLSWTVLEKYYEDPTFGGALIPGARNVFLTTEMLSPFAFEVLPERLSPISSVVRISPFTLFDGQWRIDYDPNTHQVMASAFNGDFHFGHEFVSASQYVQKPPAALLETDAVTHFNQLRIAGGYGTLNSPGLSVAGAVAYDAVSGQTQYTTVQSSYNWDCCGFAVEYRRFSLASVRREDQVLFSFNLTNVGSFGSLKRSDQLF